MTRRPRWALATVCAVAFLTSLDTIVVGVATADTQGTLHAGVSSLDDGVFKRGFRDV